MLKINKIAGQLIAPNEFINIDSNIKGLNTQQIQKLQNSFYILNKDIAVNQSLTAKDFQKAKIGVVVACRMKSSRLKRKALLPILGMPSVQRCLENCLMISHSEIVVLATSTLEEDSVLKNYTLNGKVKFWQGDPDDVIQRYIGACEYYNINVIIRATADCPVLSPEIAELLLVSHFNNGADYTYSKKNAIGSAVEIYNLEALKRVIHYLGKAEHSEYMTAYMQNNNDIFKVNGVDLPAKLVRPYRVTLDYEEDLEMLEKLYKKLEEYNMDGSLRNIFKILDNNPNIVSINNHHTTRYQADNKLINKLKKETKISS